MNQQLERLFLIAEKKERLIIGLMSGTSLDGLDIALCKISGSGKRTKLALIEFKTSPFDEEFRNSVRSVFAKKNVDLELLCQLNASVALKHAELILEALKEWNILPQAVDAIASHGQTIYHAPQRLTGNLQQPNSTLQIGDGDHIAVKTGIITISDFRQKHLAAGGEGAPLAAYGDYLLFSDERENRILLNIGGIANFTFLPSANTNQQAYATDVGPGNTLMNQYTLAHFGKEMDEDAHIAKQGKVQNGLLSELESNVFFSESFPKTTGPELFSLAYLHNAQEKSNSSGIPHEDVLATLCEFSANSIVNSILKQVQGLENVCIYVSGGGLHNPLLMDKIRAGLKAYPVESFEKLGLNPDAKEACLFALLANETLAGKPENVQQIKDSPAVCMGKISFP
ncbi:anhydro-N-acetylmuramic acid kinase [Sphingobacterium hungaricum]|uniref:Anhydro-N-acetylmuramic acid kinase n=1 Tax=Sphingobacterium hungaricum TaxID=2082723 RepID=A0A928UWR2_9SPHI|nr:anhydro-N-acetylmuramic acid kinase [Sphingobacterium hungaricum]MBE8712911.1 anhydro-N-acetylmuramic acid kinase [Sphingobacterium hungaricum]